MAVRDHYRLDVLARKAAELQEADAQLGEVQRLLASADAGIHGQCQLMRRRAQSRGRILLALRSGPGSKEARPTVLPDPVHSANGE